MGQFQPKTPRHSASGHFGIFCWADFVSLEVSYPTGKYVLLIAHLIVFAIGVDSGANPR